jgi:hypothetical protein
MQPLYMAVSLPDTFQFPEETVQSKILREAVLPSCRELDSPLSVMIGVCRQVNPRLRLGGGDGVGRADLRALENLCRDFPNNRFLASVLNSFRVIEKATGDVLLAQDGTTFSFGPELYPVVDVDNLSRSSDNIKADLLMSFSGRDSLPAGMPDRAQVSFSFTKPEVLQIHIACSRATEISEEFNDRSEHYYGIWEYPFGGNIDNRGADRDLLGLGNQRYVHHASARAPFYVTSKKYGVYVESLAQGHYAIAQAGKTRFSFQDSELTYDIIYGPSYADILNRTTRWLAPLSCRQPGPSGVSGGERRRA